MDKRFVLSAAGIAGATVAAPALAQDATITLHLDNWAGEHTMSASGSAGYVATSAGSYLYIFSSGSIVSATSFALWNSSVSAYTSGYRWDISLSDASGNYSVVLGDSYGDGWAWNSVSGLDAFVASGDVAGGDYTMSFTSGSSRTGSFTITPAPGALALLGLAGLAGRRKRA